MSTKESKQGKSGYTGNGTAIQWANVYLDRSQKAAAQLWSQDGDAVSSAMDTALASGYKVSFSFNEKTDSYICTIIGHSSGDDNQGWGMSSHSGSWFGALSTALYKHHVLGAEMSYKDMAAAYTLELP